MRRRIAPPPEPPAIDRSQIRALVTELHDAHQRGESIHATAPGYALADVAGVWAYYFAVSEIAHPAGPRSAGSIVAHIVEHAPEWLAQEDRHV